ncbi:MAG: cysteine hydrolase [Deltaproteobacteria bacterium]|nr:cysteine hydrolase [Deltaproteobacteria bacterium]
MTEHNLEQKVRTWSGLLEPYSRHPGPGKLVKSALLVVDMQRFFLDKSSHAFVPSASACLGNIKAIAEKFRQAGLPVYFTRHFHRPGDMPGSMAKWWRHLLQENDPLSLLDPRIEIKPYDLVLHKRTYSAFDRTGLSTLLEERGTEKLVITGVMTHLCVDTTAREAFVRNLIPVVVMDATAAPDEDLHISALKTLAHGVARLCSASQVLHSLSHENQEEDTWRDEP